MITTKHDPGNIMKALSILQSARDLISDKDKWIQAAYAVDEDDRVVAPFAHDACKWCAMGALSKESYSYGLGSIPYNIAYYELNMASLEPSQGFYCAIDVNDQGKHEDVMKVFDKAIKKLEDRLERAY